MPRGKGDKKMKKEIMLALNKELEEELVARNCEATAVCLHGSFKVRGDDNDKSLLRFITIEGELNITEVNNYILFTDLESLNNVIIHKDLIYDYRVCFK